MDESAGWQLDVAALPALITGRSKAIVLVNPSNPTGSILEEALLRRVGEIARETGLLLILDDPYSHFTYEKTSSFFMSMKPSKSLATRTTFGSMRNGPP